MYHNDTPCGRIPCQKINVNVNNSENPEEHQFTKKYSVHKTLCYIFKKVSRSFKILALLIMITYIVVNLCIKTFHTSTEKEELLHHINTFGNYYYTKKSDSQIITLSSNHKKKSERQSTTT